MRRLSAREQWIRSKPEKEFMGQVIEAARWLDYLVFHPYDSRRSEPGFPDIVCLGTGARRGRLVVIETKTETGRLTAEQLIWLGAWMEVPGAIVEVVRPRDMDRVIGILQGDEGS